MKNISLLSQYLGNVFKVLPAEGKGRVAELMVQDGIKQVDKVIDFFKKFQLPRIPFLLISPTFSLVLKRKSLPAKYQWYPFEELERIPSNSIGFLIDYQKAFTGLPRYTYNMSTLALAAALISISKGNFPFVSLDLAGEAILGKEQIICYPVYEYPNGDLVIRYGLIPEIIKSKIKEINPQIVGINCLTSSHHNDMIDVIKIIREIEKESGEKIIIIVGGSHSTALDEYLARSPLIDIVVRGEGEITLIELIYRLLTNQPYDDVKGISFYKEGRFIRNANRQFLNVDYLPWLARDLAPKKEMKNGQNVSAVSLYGLWHNGPFDGNGTVMMTSRGCWGSTDVCYNCFAGHMFGKLRSRNKENVISELEYLAEQGYNIISDDADQVVLPLEEFKWYCEEIMRRNLNKKLKFVTPNGLFLDGLWNLGEEGRELMVKAGYTDLCIALEGSDSFVKNVLHKPITVKYAEGVLRSFRRISTKLRIPICLTTFVMIGGPGSSNRDIEETYTFIRNLKTEGLIDQVLPFITSIIPGSKFFELFLDHISNRIPLEKKLMIFGNTFFNSKEEEMCLDALKDVECGNTFPLFTCFDTYHIWGKMRFGMPNFHEVFGQDPQHLHDMCGKLNSLNSEEINGNKTIVRRG